MISTFSSSGFSSILTMLLISSILVTVSLECFDNLITLTTDIVKPTAEIININIKIIFLILVNYHNILQNKYNYKTYHKDISFLSGRTKAIITKYGIARTDFKRLMIYHQIPNLKKSSW